MKKLLIAVLLASSIAQAGGSRRIPASAPSPSVAPSATATPVVSPSPVPPALAYQGKMISIHKIQNATDAERKMILAGADLANDMLFKKCFKQWVLAARYTENENLSQQQIYDLVTSKPMIVDVEMYTGSWKANHISKTVGYENDPFDGVVHMNRYFVNSAYMVGDNLIHEDRGHSLEFHHFGVHSTSEPYGMNYAYEGCSHVQEMQAKGGKAYRPPGIQIEIRKKKAS